MLNLDEIFGPDGQQAPSEPESLPASRAEQAKEQEVEADHETVFVFGQETWVWLEEMPEEFVFPGDRVD